MSEGRRRPSAGAVFLVFSLVVAGGAIAAALLLSGGGGASVTTVVREGGGQGSGTGSSSATSTAPGSIEAGRYVQAGSFKFTFDAEKERRRLAADGIDVEVVPSDEAQQLYPGFEVLLGGPLRSGSEEASLLKRLRHNGVPSAFARSLTPAPSQGPLGDETWTGKLEETSSSSPKLDRTHAVTFVTSENGAEATLTFHDIDCTVELESEPSSGPVLQFGRSSGCFSGSWQVRQTGSDLILTHLPPNSDTIVLGELHLR